MSRHSFSNSLSWRIIGIVSAIFFVAMVVIAIVSHNIIADEATRSTQHILHGTISVHGKLEGDPSLKIC